MQDTVENVIESDDRQMRYSLCECKLFQHDATRYIEFTSRMHFLVNFTSSDVFYDFKGLIALRLGHYRRSRVNNVFT